MILIESSTKLENIEANYIPTEKTCGDRTLTVGPGPEDADLTGEVIGRSSIGIQTTWDCCPKKEGKSACGQTKQISGF
jgi:hypothetical protein